LRGALLGNLRFRGKIELIDNARSNLHLHQWLIKVLDTLEILDADLAMLQITFVSMLTLRGYEQG